jgi:hypothetical protein
MAISKKPSRKTASTKQAAAPVTPDRQAIEAARSITFAAKRRMLPSHGEGMPITVKTRNVSLQPVARRNRRLCGFPCQATCGDQDMDSFNCSGRISFLININLPLQ